MNAARIEINGHPTWIEDRPAGSEHDPVLLLHGGLSDSELLLEGLGPTLEPNHRVVAFDRRGHGRTADTDEPFHYEDMATETIGVIETVIGGPSHLVGYSDGGIVSLFVAMRRPDLVASMVLIGTNFHHEGIHPLDGLSDPELMASIVDGYAERSPDGAEHFEVVAGKFMTMAMNEPTLTCDDLAKISSPALVLVGDDDLVKLGHTVELFEALPIAQLAIVPGTSHALPIERPEAVASLVDDFLRNPVVSGTVMPVRRAPS